MNSFWIGFIVGCFIGGFLGILGICLCISAKRADSWTRTIIAKRSDPGNEPDADFLMEQEKDRRWNYDNKK